MNNEKLLKKFKEAAERDRQNRNDPRYRRVMGFLVAKGLLKTNEKIVRLPNARLLAKDALWAATKCEPRILEVLPAALLRFPRHFEQINQLPTELLKIVEQIKNDEDGADYQGIEFKKMKRWVSFALPDGRVKPLNERKILMPFRLKPTNIHKLETLVSTGKFRSMTEAIEFAIERL